LKTLDRWKSSDWLKINRKKPIVKMKIIKRKKKKKKKKTEKEKETEGEKRNGFYIWLVVVVVVENDVVIGRRGHRRRLLIPLSDPLLHFPFLFFSFFMIGDL
jgi:hypothetical protein